MKKPLLIILMFTIPFSFLTTPLGYNKELSLRRIKDTPYKIEQLRILSIIDTIDRGSFQENGEKEQNNAMYSIIFFLDNTDIPWDMKQPILERVKSFYHRLTSDLKKELRQSFEQLDREEYNKSIAEILEPYGPTLTLWSFTIPLPQGYRYFLAEVLLDSCSAGGYIYQKIDRHLYSRYLP